MLKLKKVRCNEIFELDVPTFGAANTGRVMNGCHVRQLLASSLFIEAVDFFFFEDSSKRYHGSG